MPSQKDNSLSFWEECARETPTPSTSKDSGSSGSKMKTGGRENDTHTKSMSNKGTAKKREEVIWNDQCEGLDLNRRW